jgi:(S)-mandelate dehydrogenase
MMDSGVRRGADVVKAVALGARAVLVGRPTLYGLAARGEHGVTDVLGILRQEIDTTLALIGCARIADLGPQFLRHHAAEHEQRGPRYSREQAA